MALKGSCSIVLICGENDKKLVSEKNIYIYIYILYVYIYIYILFRHQFLVIFKLVVIVTTLICGDSAHCEFHKSECIICKLP